MTYDNKKANSFFVHKTDGIREFRATAKGLYALDLTKNKKKSEFQFLQTVEDNKEKHSKRVIEQASKAKELYGIVQYPSIPDFKNMVRFNMIKNCPITVADIEAMEDIFGPDVGALKGKTVWKKSPKVPKTSYFSMPPVVKKIKDEITIEADVI